MGRNHRKADIAAMTGSIKETIGKLTGNAMIEADHVFEMDSADAPDAARKGMSGIGTNGERRDDIRDVAKS